MFLYFGVNHLNRGKTAIILDEAGEENNSHLITFTIKNICERPSLYSYVIIQWLDEYWLSLVILYITVVFSFCGLKAFCKPLVLIK